MQSSQLKHVLIIGILFTSFFGTLAHFFYEWTGENVLAGLFTPVSESIWEHMKLIFFPMSLYGFLSKKYLKQESPCYCFAYLTGLLAGTLAIPVLFYTYSDLLFGHSWQKLHDHRHFNFLSQRYPGFLCRIPDGFSMQATQKPFSSLAFCTLARRLLFYIHIFSSPVGYFSRIGT